MVTITQVTKNDGEGYAQSYLQATLAEGGTHVLDLDAKHLHVHVNSIDSTLDPWTATVEFWTVNQPTSSPTPLPPPLVHAGNNGSPASAFPLGECEGDCDNDSECQVRYTP